VLLLVSQALKSFAKLAIPSTIYRPILAWWRRPQSVYWGNLRRLTPISSVYGLDRGKPIDRYYIERFLKSHRHEISGRVLEIGDASYTRRFGGDRVTQSDVLHVIPGIPQTTLVGNLETGVGIPREAFDCMILTQVFLVIYDVKSAIANSYFGLKSGGVLLATFPGISKINRYDMDRWGDYWRFTTLSARRLFEGVFPPENITIEAYGNVLAATAFLYGLAAEELRQKELDYRDPDYEVLITVRAVKTESTS
jgi:hypothetical protein